jgi:hypothetical protein
MQVGLNGPTDVHLRSAPVYLVLVCPFFPVFFWPVRILSFCRFHPCDGEIPSGSSQKEILGEGAHTADIFLIFGELKY